MISTANLVLGGTKTRSSFKATIKIMDTAAMILIPICLSSKFWIKNRVSIKVIKKATPAMVGVASLCELRSSGTSVRRRVLIIALMFGITK